MADDDPTVLWRMTRGRSSAHATIIPGLSQTTITWFFDGVMDRVENYDSVGLALYGVDTYPPRRFVAKNPETGETGVATEGNMFLGGAKGTGHPYPVPYRSITPKADECDNLLVPVWFSATYIAYASARMEPVFAVLGESAGVAAAQAIQAKQTVQQVDVPKLQSRLKERGQVLAWPPQ